MVAMCKEIKGINASADVWEYLGFKLNVAFDSFKRIVDMTLADLKIGQDAVLRTIGGQGELRHHLLDMGLTPGTEVTLRKVAPMGDPIEIRVRGYELTLRVEEAKKIEVEGVSA